MKKGLITVILIVAIIVVLAVLLVVLFYNPGGEPKSGEPPSEEPPSEETLGGEPQSQEPPFEEPPSEEPPSEEPPSEEPPSEEPPSEEPPGIPDCAAKGKEFSSVYTDQYPEACCEGLIEGPSGMDTRISIGEECYDTMMESGNPVGTCINCGDGICEDIENVCTCPDDCGAENSDYASAEDFCNDYVGTDKGVTEMCRENLYMLPICDLCEW